MNKEIKEILELIQEVIDEETDKFGDFKKLLDYITNLQEENEKLKQPQIFIDTMDMEERYGQELYEDYLKEQLEDFKSRIDKTNNILKDTSIDMPETLLIETIDYARHILKGDDKYDI